MKKTGLGETLIDQRMDFVEKTKFDIEIKRTSTLMSSLVEDI